MARGSRAKRKAALRVPGVALAALALGAGHGEAQLVGGHVTGGQATINALSPTSTVINQQSQNASFRWQSFSIPAGSAVAFRQPSTSSIALNTVTGGSASAIYGSLTANGHVWLINPNGIVVGPSAQVTAAGVLLSTIGTSDQDFMAGNYAFNTPGHSDAAIVNHGHVVATSGGSVVMVAPQVRNDGLVEADLGTVVLAGAKAFTVDFAGDALLKFAITKPVDAVPVGTKSLVTNTGTVAASGGTVLMTAQAAQGVLDNVINTSGIVEATSVKAVDGKIILSASGGGTEVSGTLDASGKGSGETGGTVKVLGDTVTLSSGTLIDARGDAGGGTVLVGGDFHGKGPDPNAKTTTVAKDVVIDASAVSHGNGGNVAVWSDGATDFAGSILARGGAWSGNGGFVETSGSTLTVTGTVDTRAPAGHTGMWLLDPVGNVTITSSTGCTSAGFMCSFDITSAVGSSDFALETTGDIVVASDGAMDYSSGNQLNLLANGNIDVNAGIQNSGSGALNLVAGWDGTTGLSGSTFNAGALTAGAYGNGGGSVNIGDGTQFSGIAVGSAGGTTTVAAANLTLQASTQNVSFGYAQLGFNGTGGTSSGDIMVEVTGALTLNGGNGTDSEGSYAQIGNGGLFSTSNNSGSISIAVGTSVGLYGGAGFGAYAQIGHGGEQSNVTGSGSSGTINESGSITVTGAAVTLQGGSGSDAYAQIGHGGEFANQSATASTITMSGDITVTATNAVSLAGGSGGFAYAQIGNGGYGSNQFVPSTTNATESGNIVVTVNGGSSATLSLAGGSGPSVNGDYAQIGHGDGEAATTGALSGGITVTVGGTTTLTSTADAGVLIGHNESTGAGFSGTVSLTSGTIVSGSIELQDAILHDIIGGNVSIDSTGTGPFTVDDLLYVSTHSLNLISAGSLTLVGITDTIAGAVTITAPTTTLDGNLETASGAIQVNGNIVLGGATTIATTYQGAAGAGLTIAGTIDGTSAGGQALTIDTGNSPFTLQDAIGATTPLGDVTLVASSIGLGANIITAGGIVDVSGPIVLTNNVTIFTTGGGSGGASVILGTIDGQSSGGQALTIDTGSASYSLTNTIGATTPVGAVTLNGGGIDLAADITTASGAVTINGPTTLTGSVGIVTTAGGGSGAVTFRSTIDGTSSGVDTLTVDAGSAAITMQGAVGGTTPLSAVTLAGTSGATVFKGAVTVANDIDDLRGSGSLEFDGFIDAAHVMFDSNLSVSFLGGGNFANGKIYTVDNPVTVGGTFTFGNSVGFQGTSELILGADTVIDVNGSFSVGNGSSFTIIGGGSGGQSFAVNAGGSAISVNGVLGTAAAPLGNIVLSGGSIALNGSIVSNGSVSVEGSSIALSGSVTSAGAQSYYGAASVGTGNATLNGANIGFLSTIDGPGGLTLNDPGSILVLGDVGATTPLAYLTASGTTIEIGGSVATTGPQSYTDTSLLLDVLGGQTAIYQTGGGNFTETGQTILGTSGLSSQGNSLQGFSQNSTISINISTSGGSIVFQSSGNIDSAGLPVSLGLLAGSGLVSVGSIGSVSPLYGLNVQAGEFDYLTIAGSTLLNIHAAIIQCPTCVTAVPVTLPPVLLQTTTSDTITGLFQGLLTDTEFGGLTNLVFITPPLPPVLLVPSGPSFGSGGGGEGGGEFLTSVTDLDSGLQLFSEILPDSGGGAPGTADQDPLVIIAPITPAPQPVPVPQFVDESLGGSGSGLYRYREMFPLPTGIPGITLPFLSLGNRALWFAPQGAAGGP